MGGGGGGGGADSGWMNFESGRRRDGGFAIGKRDRSHM